MCESVRPRASITDDSLMFITGDPLRSPPQVLIAYVIECIVYHIYVMIEYNIG